MRPRSRSGNLYRDGMDMEALGWRQSQAEADPNEDKYAGAGRWAENYGTACPPCTAL